MNQHVRAFLVSYYWIENDKFDEGKFEQLSFAGKGDHKKQGTAGSERKTFWIPSLFNNDCEVVISLV